MAAASPAHLGLALQTSCRPASLQSRSGHGPVQVSSPLFPEQGWTPACRSLLPSLLTHLVPSWGLGCVIYPGEQTQSAALRASYLGLAFTFLPKTEVLRRGTLSFALASFSHGNVREPGGIPVTADMWGCRERKKKQRGEGTGREEAGCQQALESAKKEQCW